MARRLIAVLALICLAAAVAEAASIHRLRRALETPEERAQFQADQTMANQREAQAKAHTAAAKSSKAAGDAAMAAAKNAKKAGNTALAASKKQEAAAHYTAAANSHVQAANVHAGLKVTGKPTYDATGKKTTPVKGDVTARTQVNQFKSEANAAKMHAKAATALGDHKTAAQMHTVSAAANKNAAQAAKLHSAELAAHPPQHITVVPSAIKKPTTAQLHTASAKKQQKAAVKSTVKAAVSKKPAPKKPAPKKL